MPSSSRIYLFTCCAALIMFLAPTFAQKPYIIYIMTDDMGYGDIGPYGQKKIKTPNLDRLANEGIIFKQAYAAGPLCTPTRVGFMTGRYPARTPVGLIEPLTATKRDSAFGLSPDYPSVASMVRRAGYETVLIGKWHLGFKPEFSPNNNGYDYFFGFHSGVIDYISHKGDGRRPDLYENGKPFEMKGYATDVFSDKAVSFIKQKHSKPFFLTLNYNAPHWPWQDRKSKPYEDKKDFTSGGNAAIYAAMIESLDEGVGKILRALEEQGLRDSTLLIFTNDNGGERYSDHGGLAKSKMTLWEGGIRVPAIVRWPGKVKPATFTDQAIITMDWTATILDAAGAQTNPDFKPDGISLIPTLKAERKDFDRTFYWRTFQRAQQKAIRDGKWKYIKDASGEYLFDIVADPGEKKDLKTSNPEIFENLKLKYAAWEKTVLRPIPLNEPTSPRTH
jgi:arylsulfatase A-like enzyme